MSRKINRMKQIHQTILFIFCISKEPKDQLNEANTSNNIFVSRKEPKDQSNEANTSNDICSQRNDLSGEAMCDRLVPAAKKNAEAKRRPNRSVLMMMMLSANCPLQQPNSSVVEDGYSRDKLTTGTDKDTRDAIRRKQAMKTLAWRVSYLKSPPKGQP